MAPKLSRMLTYLNGLLPIKSHYFLITWYCKTTITVPLATKLGRMVTYLNRVFLLQLKTQLFSSPYIWLAYTFEARFSKISSVDQSELEKKVVSQCHRHCTLIIQLLTFWWRGLSRSRDWLRMLYSHYHTACGNQTGWWLTVKHFTPKNYMTIWSCGHVKN